MFFVKNGEIHTPIADCFLNGITRQSVIALAKRAADSVIERHIQPEELSEFTECFLTGTAAEVTPCCLRFRDRATGTSIRAGSRKR